MKANALIGEAPAFQAALALIDRIARYDVAILIEGETGTGKELAARAIHHRSARAGRPFVAVNCGTLPDTLVENELFGHERGAYSDARSEAVGLVEAAQRGTLFLDEVDALPLRAQGALLRFLPDGTYRPLGGRTEKRSDVRILAASNGNLDTLAESGAFRADLLYRLKQIPLTLPPLRARPGDPTLLAHHFLAQLNCQYATDKVIGPLLEAWMEAQLWPGNVRELESFVRQTYILTTGNELLPPGEDPDVIPSGSCARLPPYRRWRVVALAVLERKFLQDLLTAARGNISRAARLADYDRRNLGRLIRKHGLKPESFANTA